MYLKLSIRSAKRSISDYFLYMLTMTVLIAIMAVSNLVAIIGEMQAGFQTASLPILIALILVILTEYINRFMLKQRAKEFANYLLLGMEKGKLLQMILTEFLLVGLLCLIVGVLVGAGIFTLLFSTLFHSLKVTEIELSFFLESFVQTFLYFSAVELLSLLRVRRTLNRLQIRELMMEKKRNQKSAGKQRRWGILFVASFLCLFGMLFAIAYSPDSIAFPMVSILSLPLILTVFAFYQWLSQFLSLMRQKQPVALYQKNRLYSIAQMTAETKTSAIMNSVFCICLIFSLAAFAFGALLLQPGMELLDTESQQWMGFLQICICIIFIVIYFSILCFQQIVALKREAQGLQILHYLGKTKTQIKKLVRLLVLIKLSLPAVLCYFPALLALPLLNNKLNRVLPAALTNILAQSVGWFTACFLILYGGYFCVVCAITRQYVERKTADN